MSRPSRGTQWHVLRFVVQAHARSCIDYKSSSAGHEMKPPLFRPTFHSRRGKKKEGEQQEADNQLKRLVRAELFILFLISQTEREKIIFSEDISPLPPPKAQTRNIKSRERWPAKTKPRRWIMRHQLDTPCTVYLEQNCMVSAYRL